MDEAINQDKHEVRTRAWISYKGELYSMRALSFLLGVDEKTLRSRVRSGWPEHRWGEAKNKKGRREKARHTLPCLGAYSEEELIILWRDRCAPEKRPYRMLADFALCSEEEAKEMVRGWEEKGYLKGAKI